MNHFIWTKHLSALEIEGL